MRITTHHPELTESGLVRCEDGGLRPPWAAVSDELRHYYDTEWGAPVTDEAHIFERICLEGFQSGLSWQTILAKRPLLRKLFHGFDPDAVAKFTEADIERLMQVSGMIRNRRKIAAVIANAKATIELRKSGGLSHLVWSFRPAHHERPTTVAGIASTSPESTALAKELKRHGFQFVGPTTVYATMQAIGLVDDRVVGAAPLVRYGEHMSEKTAVVTGGSSGIGEAAARALAADGWHVIVAARRLENLQRIAEEIGGTAIRLDVMDDDSVAEFAAQVSRCDLLVNNAGGAKGLDPIAEADVADWQWMYDTNVMGTMRVTKALLPRLTEAHGHVVNIGSIAGLRSYRGGAGYNAAKHGVHSLSHVMRMEFVDAGVRVTEINPGRVQTDFSLVRFKGDAERANAVYDGHQNLVADDIAETIRWVAGLPSHVNIDQVVVTPQEQVIW